MRIHRDFSREFTSWCAGCEKWEQLPAERVRAFVKQLRQHGWRQRKGRWFCPDCFAANREPIDREAS